MTTFTNSEGKLLTYTNELLEAILFQLNSSNNYYTSGEHDIIFIKIGSNKILILDYISHQPKHFSNHSVHKNLINSYDLEFILNGASNGYDLQSVHNVNGLLGVITELSQVCLAIYDTDIIPFSYTGSENIDFTDNQISLNFQIKINNEIVLHPRAYDGAVFDLLSGADNFSFMQNSIHGGTLITQFNSPTKECTFYGNCSIPFFIINHRSIH